MSAEIVPFAEAEHRLRAGRLPPRRSAPLPLAAGTRVLARPHVQLTAYGTVIGVARMAPPRYDVQLDNGLRFNDLPAERVEEIAGERKL